MNNSESLKYKLKRFVYGMKLLWKYKFSISDLEQSTYLKAYNEGIDKGKDFLEDRTLKFYYCESNGKYYVGQRCDTRYYAEVMWYPSGEVVLCHQMSRYLPWGETLNGYTYPSEPVEISFEKFMEWLLVKRLEVPTPLDKAITF